MKKNKIPKSNIDWLLTIFEQNGSLKNNVKYFKHGFGIDFRSKNWKVSIDFGPKGEWDGFDSWRLFIFLEDNKIKSKIKNESEIENLLKIGFKKDLFVKKGELYFKNI